GLALGLRADVGAGPLDQGGMPLGAAVEAFALDQVRPVAERDVGTIEVDGLACPWTGEPQLAPFTDVRPRTTGARRRPLPVDPAAGALRTVDAVDLVEGQPAQGVVLVHDEHQSGRCALWIVIGTAGKSDLERRVAK